MKYNHFLVFLLLLVIIFIRIDYVHGAMIEQKVVITKKPISTFSSPAPPQTPSPTPEPTSTLEPTSIPESTNLPRLTSQPSTQSSDSNHVPTPTPSSLLQTEVEDTDSQVSTLAQPSTPALVNPTPTPSASPTLQPFAQSSTQDLLIKIILNWIFGSFGREN